MKTCWKKNYWKKSIAPAPHAEPRMQETPGVSQPAQREIRNEGGNPSSLDVTEALSRSGWLSVQLRERAPRRFPTRRLVVCRVEHHAPVAAFAIALRPQISLVAQSEVHHAALP